MSDKPPSTRQITHLAGGVNVADICGNTRGTTDIVQAERCDERVTFEEEGERLANSSSSAEHGDFVEARCRGREEPGGGGGEGAGC
jgi:hypothetical protein